jgi:hypothetical protein
MREKNWACLGRREMSKTWLREPDISNLLRSGIRNARGTDCGAKEC